MDMDVFLFLLSNFFCLLTLYVDFTNTSLVLSPWMDGMMLRFFLSLLSFSSFFLFVKQTDWYYIFILCYFYSSKNVKIKYRNTRRRSLEIYFIYFHLILFSLFLLLLLLFVLFRSRECCCYT